jgi:hypothetical protein
MSAWIWSIRARRAVHPALASNCPECSASAASESFPKQLTHWVWNSAVIRSAIQLSVGDGQLTVAPTVASGRPRGEDRFDLVGRTCSGEAA